MRILALLSAIAAGALVVVPAHGAPATDAAPTSLVAPAAPVAGTIGGQSAPAAASGTDACLAQQSSHLIRLTGAPDEPVQHPVLLVHGWLSTAMPEAQRGPRPVTSTTGIANSPFSRPVAWTSDTDAALDLRSLQQRLDELPDTTVFAFDYSSVAALWVGHTSTSAALAGAIDCLASASGGTVDVVAHSMGGLALRYALGDSDDGLARHIGQVVTVATPNEGSTVASFVDQLGTATQTFFSSASVIADIALPAIVGICNRELESDARVGCDIPPSARTVFAIAGDGGRALRAGSIELASVPAWPSTVQVHAIAGDYRIHLTASLLPPEVFSALSGVAHTVGLDLAPNVDETFSPGDGIVDVSSATAGAASTYVAQCDVSIDLTTTDGAAQFGDLTDRLGGIPPLAGPCAHDRLFENADVVGDIVATLGARR